MSAKSKFSFAAQLIELHSNFGNTKEAKPFAFTFDVEVSNGFVIFLDGNSKFKTSLKPVFKGKAKCEIKKAKFEVNGFVKSTHCLNTTFTVTDYKLSEKNGKEIKGAAFTINLNGDQSQTQATGFNNGELQVLKKPLLEKVFQSSLELHPKKFFVPFLDSMKRLAFGGRKQAIIMTCPVTKRYITKQESKESTPKKAKDIEATKNVVFSQSTIEKRKAISESRSISKVAAGTAQKKTKTA